MCRKVTAQPARDGAVKTEREMLENLVGFLWSLALFPPIDFLYVKRYNKALTEHTALVENLQREGGETMALEAVKLVAQADAKGKELLAQAEKDAAEDAAKIKQQADADCAALRTNAKKRLEEAASLIVRKVVDA